MSGSGAASPVCLLKQKPEGAWRPGERKAGVQVQGSAGSSLEVHVACHGDTLSMHNLLPVEMLAKQEVLGLFTGDNF